MKAALVSTLALALCLIGNVSFAGTSSGGGIGGVATYVTCTGSLTDGTKASFEVRSTAAPSIKDSVLLNSETNELLAHLYCEPGTDVAPGTPSAGKTEWGCGLTQWDHSIDSGTIVTVMKNSMGVTTAQIEEKQMFPLPNLQLGSLICK